MQQQFTVSHNGQEIGPFSKEAIVEKIKSNQLFPTDYVYVEEKSDWITLLEFTPEVFGVNAPKATVPPVAEKKSIEVPKVEKIEKVEKAAKAQQASAKAVKVSTPAVKNENTVHEIKLDMVTLEGGVGTIELLQYVAGEVHLEIQSDKLKSEGVEKFVVNAASASAIKLSGPESSTAGETCRIELEALDKWGNRDSHFSEKIAVSLSEGAEVKGGEVHMKQGRGHFEFVSKKADKIRVSLGKRGNLDMSSSWTVDYHPGPAARLVVESPTEVVAGQPIKVQVRAVDEFGNLAVHCNDSVKLAVNAPSKEKAA